METIGIVGLGYVGLPLALYAAQRGDKVVGIDISATVIDKLNKKVSPFAYDPKINVILHSLPPESFTATSDFQLLQITDTILICVPTPTRDGMPDLSAVITASQNIAPYIQKGQLVSLESTVSAGTTRDVVLPILEAGSGLVAGKDFYLVHCPERVDPANTVLPAHALNRVIGGITDACTEKGLTFYRYLLKGDVLPMGSVEEAEFVKSWENTHRNVLIAMANSAALISDTMGWDIKNIIAGMQSKVDQFGLQLAQPGIGIGGHCISEDIHYVIAHIEKEGLDSSILRAATRINEKMPIHTAKRFIKLIESHGENIANIKIAVLGLSYKPDINDIRNSPSLRLIDELKQHSNTILVHDPYISEQAYDSEGVEYMSSLDDVLCAADALCIATPHTIYKERLSTETLKCHGIRYVLDGRNSFNKEDLLAADIHYQGVGR